MKTSDQINELAAAMAAASAEFPPIQRNSKMFIRAKEGKPAREYYYADLDDMLSAVRGPLAKHGLFLSHDCKVTDEPFVAWITARLCHASGQWKESEPMPIPCEGFMSAAQQIGSANTYGRRYTAQNLLGISTESDDDGQSAGGAEDYETSRREQKPKPSCPECGKPDHVYEDRQKGGFFCWKQKGGCGHNWLPQAEQPADPPKEKSEAKKLADAHGMKTGDEIAHPEKTAFQRAMAAISECVRNRDSAKLMVIGKHAKKCVEDGTMTANEDANVLNEIAVAMRKIEALNSQDAAVAAEQHEPQSA